MNGTFIRVLKYGSIPFHYFKDEGVWNVPGRTTHYHDVEVNLFDEPIEILYDPRGKS